MKNSIDTSTYEVYRFTRADGVNAICVERKNNTTMPYFYASQTPIFEGSKENSIDYMYKTKRKDEYPFIVGHNMPKKDYDVFKNRILSPKYI